MFACHHHHHYLHSNHHYRHRQSRLHTRFNNPPEVAPRRSFHAGELSPWRSMNNVCQGRGGDRLVASKTHHNKHSVFPNHRHKLSVPSTLRLFSYISLENSVTPLPRILQFCGVNEEIDHKLPNQRHELSVPSILCLFSYISPEDLVTAYSSVPWYEC